MVGTDDSAVLESALKRGANYRATMPAGIMVCPWHIILVTRHYNLLRADLRDKVITGLRNLLEAANGDPVPVPDGLELTLVVIGVDIPVRR